MNISLREITNENWMECAFLTSKSEYVASNSFSIAQSKMEDGWIAKAIFLDEVMVGFTMYGFCHKANYFELCRIMIDHKFQGKGYGTVAIKNVIEEMKRLTGCHEIYLSFDPANQAKKLYERFGFKDTGKLDHEEVVYSLKLN